MDDAEIRATIDRLILEFPEDRRTAARQEANRQAFHALLALKLSPLGPLADVGGGIGLLSVTCAALGADTTLIDDFADPVNVLIGDSALDLHRKYGVKVIERDVVAEGLGLPESSLDLFMTFDNIEHVHHSPKALYHEAMRALRPGGHMVIGAPNSANLRKRIAAPLGKAKWSSMSDWYEQSRFRGHVREPDVADLLYIAKDLQLQDVRIIGRNWQAYRSSDPRVRRLAPKVDRPLQRWPSLCADIYMIGRVPRN